MSLEQDLRNALRREEPPEGFAERVLARVAREDARQPWWAGWWRSLRTPALAWAAAAAIFVALVAGIQYQNRRMERARAEVARREVMLALRIAGSKLHMVQTRVQQIGIVAEKKL